MPIFHKTSHTLHPISETQVDLEKDIQLLTEANLDVLFGLRFVSGRSNQEFAVKVLEQDFYIDTLAIEESQHALVIIEYKKDRNFSIIDQGFSYLSALLHNKAEFVLEVNRRLGTQYDLADIDWEQTRLIFISPKFTNYQKNAINFKDLPFSLYEFRMYSNGLVEYDPIKPFRTTESIQAFTKDVTIKSVTKEVKVITLDDLVKPMWEETHALLSEFEQQLMTTQPDTRIKYNKNYIAYLTVQARNYVEIVPQQRGLKVYYRFPHNFTKSSLKLSDCSQVGHWTNGDSFIHLNSSNQVTEAVRLATISHTFIQQKQ